MMKFVVSVEANDSNLEHSRQHEGTINVRNFSPAPNKYNLTTARYSKEEFNIFKTSKRHLSKAYFLENIRICINYVSVEISFSIFHCFWWKYPFVGNSIFLKYLLWNQKKTFSFRIRSGEIGRKVSGEARKIPSGKISFNSNFISSNSCWESDVCYA